MPTPSNTPARRRTLWPWVLLAVILAPAVLLGTAVASYLSLDRDAAVVRRQVMRATNGDWHTKVQVSLGSLSFSVVRGCLSFVQNKDVDEAKFALRAVRSASVGVYQRQGRGADWSGAELLNSTDKAMRARGWTRVVGVMNGNDIVMVYVPADSDELDEVCVAVVNGRELVVVSAEVRPKELVALVERHAGEKLKLRDRLRLAGG